MERDQDYVAALLCVSLGHGPNLSLDLPKARGGSGVILHLHKCVSLADHYFQLTDRKCSMLKRKAESIESWISSLPKRQVPEPEDERERDHVYILMHHFDPQEIREFEETVVDIVETFWSCSAANKKAIAVAEQVFEFWRACKEDESRFLDLRGSGQYDSTTLDGGALYNGVVIRDRSDGGIDILLDAGEGEGLSHVWVERQKVS
jgi:hypothetical protein